MRGSKTSFNVPNVPKLRALRRRVDCVCVVRVDLDDRRGERGERGELEERGELDRVALVAVLLLRESLSTTILNAKTKKRITARSPECAFGHGTLSALSVLNKVF